jgi:methylated-DNA-protein-cysteine methyltransferase related protein
MDKEVNAQEPIYARIYATICQVPPGKVVTYGQVAKITGGCTARMVGYALSALKEGMDVPWQRVVNYKGKISPHGFGYGSALQRQLLVEEGVQFNAKEEIDLEIFGYFFE